MQLCPTFDGFSQIQLAKSLLSEIFFVVDEALLSGIDMRIEKEVDR